MASRTGPQIEILRPGLDVAVEGDPEVFLSAEGIPFVGQVHGRTEARIADLHVVYLFAYLGIRSLAVRAQPFACLSERHGQPAFVDHGVVLLLQLHEDRIRILRGVVTPYPEFLLVQGLLDGAPGEEVVLGVEVYVADAAVGETVGFHVQGDSFGHSFCLRFVHQVLQFVPLEHAFDILLRVHSSQPPDA